jgi:hypothetical protein
MEYNMTEFWIKAGIEDNYLCQWICNPKKLEIKQLNLIEKTRADNFDLNEPINWRVFSVLGIFHNLSYEEANQISMGENKALLRYYRKI